MEKLLDITIQGYEVKERIGAGGFGTVYRARQHSINREVAIKVILPGHANNPNFIRRFENEAQLIARLEHLHITPLYDYWRDPDGAYLVMRYMRGGSLAQAINDAPYSLKDMSRILDQIASALHTAHQQGVIHRDIKPANILLDEDGNAYLSDFGIAKDLADISSNMTRDDAIVGSLDYLSPEQARSEPVTPQTDIYSLGVTLYELISGKHPFHEFSSIERLYKHINERLPEISELDDTVGEAVNAVIEKSTAKNPSQRYSDVLEMASAFRQAISGNDSQTGEAFFERFTPREQDILELIVEGMSNKKIAETLFITVSTVKWYNQQLYSKLGVRSRAQAIVRVRELNLLGSGDDVRDEQAAKLSLLPVPVNPYKGLRAFEANDRRDYFGRDRLIDKLISRLQEETLSSRFLAVVGPSGSGKSSVVKAGLIPAIQDGRLPGSDKWYVVDMLPGSRPLDKLEIALLKIAANQGTNLNEQLNRDDYGLVRSADLILPDDDSQLVLVIDQFEEVFTQVESEETRQQFLDLIYTAVTESRSRVCIIVTLRADYYDRPLQYQVFGELLRSRMETVLPLSAKEIERAINGPLERMQVTFELGLVAQVVSEMTYQAGALPLLQYALTELFERREGRLLTHEAYRGIGGAIGALAKRAEATYQEFDAEAQALTQQMFLRLVTLGEGAEDTRRRVSRSELLAIAADADLMDDIIDTFSVYRLLSLDNDSASRSPTVEVAHEAILREWERLREWINVARNDIHLQRQLNQLAEDWIASGEDSSYLLQGTRLEQFEAWRETNNLALTGREITFIESSQSYHIQREADESARQEREINLEQRSQTVLRALVAVFAIATLIAGGLTIFAFSERSRAEEALATSDASLLLAEERSDEIQSRVLVDNAQDAYDNGDVTLAMMLLMESMTFDNAPATAEKTFESVAFGHGVIQYIDAERFTAPIFSVNFSSDNRSILVSTGDEISSGEMAIQNSGMYLINIASGEVIQEFIGHHALAVEQSLSPDGRYLLSSGLDAQTILWDVETGEILHDFTGFTRGGMTWSDDSQKVFFLLTQSSDTDASNVPRWFHNLIDASLVSLDISNGNIEFFLSFNDMENWDREVPVSAVVSPDVKSVLVVYATRREVEESFINDDINIEAVATNFIDLENGELIRRYRRASAGEFINNDLLSVYYPDDSSNIIGSFLIERGSLERVASVGTDLIPQHKNISSNNLLVHNPLNNEFISYDVETYSELNRVAIRYKSGLGNVVLQASADGNYLAVSDEAGLYIWDMEDVDTSLPVARELVPYVDEIKAIDFSPDGRRLLSASGRPLRDAELLDSAIRLWDIERGELIRTLEGHEEAVTSIAFSLDALTALSASRDNTVILWDLETGEIIRTFEGHSDWVWDVAFSPDGTIALSASKDGTLILWDIASGEIIRQLEGHNNWVNSAEFSPDGRWIASGSDFDGGNIPLIIWNAETGDIIHQIMPEHRNVNSLAFSPDSTRLVTGMSDGYMLYWNVESGELLEEFHYQDIGDGRPLPVHGVDIDSSGRFAVIGQFDGYITIIDLESGERIATFRELTGYLWDVRFSPDVRSIASSGVLVNLWDISAVVGQYNLLEWVQENRYLREFTCEERDRYGILPYCG